MEKIIVENFDSALDALIDKIAEPDFSDFELPDHLSINIKLEGTQWDGRLDYKVGEFVVRLQKAILTLYSINTEIDIRYGSPAVELGGLRVTVAVENGCSLFKIDLGEWWKKMEAKHTLAAITIVAGLYIGVNGAVTAYSTKVNADAQVQTAEIQASALIKNRLEERLDNEDERNKTAEIVKKTLDMAGNTNYYMTYLAGRMAPGDTMETCGIRLTAEEAKKRYRHSEIEKDQTKSRFFIDGDYVVTTIHREKDTATIQFPDKKRNLSLVWLNDNELEQFYKSCATRGGKDTLQPIPLQITANFAGGVFKDGFIQGLGPKREGAVSFHEAVLESSSRQEDEERAEAEDYE